MSMTQTEPIPPRAHARIVYLGPVEPHWEVYSEFGDRHIIDDFRTRVRARLLLLPPHDPQFRRNRERVVRDAEREARREQKRKLTLIDLGRLYRLWVEHQPSIPEESRLLLPLTPVYYLDRS